MESQESIKSELSTQTMVVITKIGDYWVTPTEASNIQMLLENTAKGMVNLEGNLIAISSIQGILTASAYEVVNYKRRFAWQCKYKYWHEKNQQCAHTRPKPH